MSDLQEHYHVLRLPQRATQAEIKQSFRQLARRYHPDLNPNDPESAEIFRKVCKAYEVLSQHGRQFATNIKSESELDPDTPINGALRHDFQKAYIQALGQISQKNYGAAIADFTQALTLNPKSLEAYMGRCQARFAMGDDHGVLNDCQEIIKLKPQTAQAHYLQGRSRHRLGNPQLAVEDYSRAIVLSKDYAKAYYHRGMAQVDAQRYRQGTRDLQVALKLFRKQNNMAAYQQVSATLKTMQTGSYSQTVTDGTLNEFGPILQILPKVLLNPAGHLLSTFSLLSPIQAMMAGLLFSLIAIFAATLGLLFQSSPFSVLPGPLVVLGGGVLFLSLFTTSALSRAVMGNSDSWPGDVYLAGSALLPIGVWFLLGGVSLGLGQVAFSVLTVSAFCLLVLTLYNGCTQLNNLPEAAAVYVVPLMVMVSGFALSLVASLGRQFWVG